jgi:hypothetical protein
MFCSLPKDKPEGKAMIRTIAYACANKRCRQSENDALEQKREKIRELHQQQQDSLKALQALESKLNEVTIDDGGKPQGLHLPPQVPTPGPVFGVAAQDALPSNTLGPHIQSNVVMTNLPRVDSDSSDSEAILSDEEEEHMSLEELTKAAQHVQKMLARIELLIKSSAVTQDSKTCRKRRVNKIYKRFCRRWESDISIGPVSPRKNRAFYPIASTGTGQRAAPRGHMSMGKMPRSTPQQDTRQTSHSQPQWDLAVADFSAHSLPNSTLSTSYSSRIPMEHPIPVPPQNVNHQYPPSPSTGPTTLPYFLPSVTAAGSMSDTNIRSGYGFSTLDSFDFGFDSILQDTNKKTAENHSPDVAFFPFDEQTSTQNPDLKHRVYQNVDPTASTSYPSIQYSTPSRNVPRSRTQSSGMLLTKLPRFATSGSVGLSTSANNDITTSGGSTKSKNQILWAGSRDILTSEAEAEAETEAEPDTTWIPTAPVWAAIDTPTSHPNESNMSNDQFPYFPLSRGGSTVTQANSLPMEYNISSQNMEWSRPMSSDPPMPTAENRSDSNYSAMENSTLEFSTSEFYDFGSSSLESPNQKSTRSFKPKPTQFSQKWHSCSDPGCRQCFVHEDQWQQHIETSHQKDPIMPVRKFPGDLTTGGGTVSCYGSPESLGSAVHPFDRTGPGPLSKSIDFDYGSLSLSEPALRVLQSRGGPNLRTRKGRPRLRDDSAGEKEGNMQRKSTKGLSLRHSDTDNAMTTTEDTHGPTPQETPNHLPSMHDSDLYVSKSAMREEVPQYLNTRSRAYDFKMPDAAVPKLSAEGNSGGADHLMSPLDVPSSPGHGPVPRIINSAPSEESCPDSESAPLPTASSNGYCVEPYSSDMEEPMDPAAMSYRRSDGVRRQRHFPDTMLPARKKGIKQPPLSAYVSTKRGLPDSVEPESKRRKLSLPSHFDMEPPVVVDTMESKGSDRDIVDVLLERWTIPVY